MKQSVAETLLRAKSHERKGELDEARRLYREILKRFPGNARASQSLARLGEAEAASGQLDALQDAVNALVALYNRGELQAVIDKARQLTETYPDAFALWSILGVSLAQAGDAAAAETALRRARSLNRNSPDVHNNLGNVLKDQGKFGDAQESYRRALQLWPDYAEAHNNLGNILKDTGDLDQAVQSYRRAIRVKPDYAEAHVNLGTALQQLEALPEAVESYRKALELAPESAVAHNNLGNALSGQGKFEEAASSYRRALDINPDYADCYRHLGDIEDYAADDPRLAQMQRIHDAADTSPSDRCNICFALAKAYDDLGDTERALGYLKEGNALRKEILGYDIAEDRTLFAAIRATCEQIDKLKPARQQAAPAVVPIFILGMPRSGTTLVEQIVSSHSAVQGGGELEYARSFGQDLATGTVRPSAHKLAEFRRKYLAAIARLANGNRYVTDKAPQNFRFIALIAKALPEARIIHVTRDPRAVCWSNFRQYFASSGQGYSYDLQDVASYYRMYEELMAFWSETHPGRLYELSYEELTQRPEEEIRRLIAHIGLEWEEACLHPHRNDRAVATASRRQVRDQIYQGSSQQWTRFAPFLEGALDGLG
jgi:tetratricopeptide (TPR) repeat protein